MNTIVRLFDHMYWANRQLLEGIRANGGGNEEALRLFRHVAVAELVWLTRLEGKSSAGLELWKDASFDEVEKLIGGNEASYKRYLASLAADRLDDEVEYASQSGVRFRTSIRDILAHVALHGQYHRGQINRAMREGALSPTPMDFIVFSRVSE